jgi:predicted permease
VFSGLAAFGIWQFRLGTSDDVRQIWGEPVSANYFELLGVLPHLGRTFLAEEDSVPGRNPVVVLSHALWVRQFAADSGVVGEQIRVNGQSLTVVGVAPPEFTGMLGGMAAELWVPTMLLPLLEPARGEAIVTSRGNSWLTMVGRLKPGVTIEQARAEFAVLSDAMRAAYPNEWTREDGRAYAISVLSERQTRIHPGMRAGAFGAAGLLFAIVTLLMVVACVNLAGVLFARSELRRAEISMRLALGASRRRVLRQLLTESMLLAMIAGAAGAAFAVWSLNLLVAFMPALPEGIRIAIDLRVDWTVALFAIGFSSLTGVLFGLAPALHASKTDLASVLRDEAAHATGSRRVARARRFLIGAQVACSLTLMIGAGLVLRSLDQVRPTQLGFRSDKYVVAFTELDEARYDKARSARFFEELGDQLARIPGVTSVSFVNGIPGGFLTRSRRGTAVEGYTPRAGEDMSIDASIVGPHYFTNLGVPVVQGRDFDARDRAGSPCVAIVNEAFGRRYFADAPSPLGRRIAGSGGTDRVPAPMCEIVGVIRDDAWQSLLEAPRPFFALPLLQEDRRSMTALVETSGDETALVPAVRQTIRSLDAEIATNDVQTLDALFGTMALPFRIVGYVLSACGALALLLAVIGIYGVVAHSVVRRRREVGIRVALGAVHRDIVGMVIREGMRPVVYGVVAGLAVGAAVAQLLASGVFGTGLLFGVGPADLLTFVGVTVLLGCVALAACYVPAHRASRVDPLVALRSG